MICIDGTTCDGHSQAISRDLRGRFCIFPFPSLSPVSYASRRGRICASTVFIGLQRVCTELREVNMCGPSVLCEANSLCVCCNDPSGLSPCVSIAIERVQSCQYAICILEATCGWCPLALSHLPERCFYCSFISLSFVPIAQ